MWFDEKTKNEYTEPSDEELNIIYDLGELPVPSKYQSLKSVFDEAMKQASEGKGKERHADDCSPFEKQTICWIERQGLDFARGQAVKKIVESMRLEPRAAIEELLGAMNYIAACVIVIREKI